MAGAEAPLYKILLVDDSPDDRLIIRRAMRQFPRFDIVGEVEDGAECIAYLTGEGQFADRTKHPFPDLVLLDLKMPRKNGFDVLNWLRGQGFEKLTVVVLSGSMLDQDIGASLALGAHGFWTKASTPEKHGQIAREVETLMDLRSGRLK